MKKSEVKNSEKERVEGSDCGARTFYFLIVGMICGFGIGMAVFTDSYKSHHYHMGKMDFWCAMSDVATKNHIFFTDTMKSEMETIYQGRAKSFGYKPYGE